MCKVVYYLYKCPNGSFEVKPLERKDFIISSKNVEYITSVSISLNFLHKLKIPISNDMILGRIIRKAIEQNAYCDVTFNKENQI